MNVDDHHALQLIRGFARIEFALKTLPEFVKGKLGDTPETQWTAYYPIARQSIGEATSKEARDVLLGTHANDPPPKKMVITAVGEVDFEDCPLQGPIGDKLMDAARRVRNNLVHGGKERAFQERYPGHDQRLVVAALEVIHIAAAADARVARLFF